MSSKKPELTFKYVFNYGYNPTYVNGAQGGFSPRGEMVINFYLERQPLPESISHEITSEGAIGRETSVEPKDLAGSMVRFIDTGVVMSYEPNTLAQQFTVDVLYGAAVIRNGFGIQVNS